MTLINGKLEGKNKSMSEIPDKMLVACKLFQKRYGHTIGSMTRSLNYVEVKDANQLPTMAVDKFWRFYYNPEFIERTPVEELVSGYFHECMHLFYRHPIRMTKYHPSVANQAGDMVINQTIIKHEKLPEIKLRLPEDPKARWCYPGVRNNFPMGLTEEEYAALIDAQAIKIPVHVNCGSGGNGGKRMPYELPGNDKDNPGMSEHEQKITLEKIAKDILDNAEKNKGDVPEYMIRMAQSIITPVIDFYNEIKQTLCNPRLTRGRMYNSYSRPTRRTYLNKLYPHLAFPGKVAKKKTLGFIIDTSGSMSESDLAKCIGCANRALQDISKYDLIIGAADAELHDVTKVKSLNDIKLKGGGGTSMTQAVVSFQKQWKVDLLCILTDCETDWPSENQLKQDTVVISILHNSRQDSGVPTYMKEINFNKCQILD